VSYQLLADGLRYEFFPDISQPTLLFHGKHDTVVLPTCSAEFAQGRSNVSLRIVESGHELTDVLEQIWAVVQPFCLGETHGGGMNLDQSGM
jgi:pimeloyl-ACP methyl ester carboxylesterase